MRKINDDLLMLELSRSTFSSHHIVESGDVESKIAMARHAGREGELEVF